MELTLTGDDGKKIAAVKIDQMCYDDEHADYIVTLYVERGENVAGFHRRMITNFPIKALNPLALVKSALNLFPPDVFGAEDDDRHGDASSKEAPVSSALERGFNRALPEVPSGVRGLCYHGPAFRGEQSEQYGDDGERKG